MSVHILRINRYLFARPPAAIGRDNLVHLFLDFRGLLGGERVAGRCLTVPGHILFDVNVVERRRLSCHVVVSQRAARLAHGTPSCMLGQRGRLVRSWPVHSPRAGRSISLSSSNRYQPHIRSITNNAISVHLLSALNPIATATSDQS